MLQSSHSDRDLTLYRQPPAPQLPNVVIVEKKAPEPKPAQIPLNCCGRYEIPLPYPTVIVRKER